MNKKKKLNRLVICAFFMALTVVMTFTPLGYIPVGVISITTIHIATILGACILGVKYGAILGGTWGALCIVKAFQEGYDTDSASKLAVAFVLAIVFHVKIDYGVYKYLII